MRKAQQVTFEAAVLETGNGGFLPIVEARVTCNDGHIIEETSVVGSTQATAEAALEVAGKYLRRQV